MRRGAAGERTRGAAGESEVNLPCLDIWFLLACLLFCC